MTAITASAMSTTSLGVQPLAPPRHVPTGPVLHTRAAARAALVTQLKPLTSDAESVADALLQCLRLTEGGQVFDLQFMAPYVAECIEGMNGSALNALQACAVAAGGQITQVIFREGFEPTVRMLEQMRLLAVGPVGTRDLDAEVHQEMSLSSDLSLWEMSTEASKFADERAEHEGAEPLHAPAPAPAGAEVSEPSPTVTMQTDKFRLQMFFCSQNRPRSPLTPQEAARYDQLSQLLRDIMSLPPESTTFQAELRLRREFFADPFNRSSLDLALRHNPWAAAALVLGILESDASLLMRAGLLNRDAGGYVQKVVDKLAKVRSGPDRQRAQALIKKIEAAWAPANHLLMLNGKKSVMLKNSPSSAHSADCHRGKLTVVGPVDGGQRMICSAVQDIPHLKEFLEKVDEVKGTYTYGIPTEALCVRHRPLLRFFGS